MVIKIGGFQECSLQDYPGKVASIVFLINCNLRCKYCYNIDLLSEDNFKKSNRRQIDEYKLLDRLYELRKNIDGVVITGGEPLLDSHVLDFIMRIKAMNLLVKIDTNGTNPELLRRLINNNFVDYIAMDIKAPLNKYKELCGFEDIDKIKTSIELIQNSSILHEFRHTLWPMFDAVDVERIVALLPGQTLFLQRLEQTNALTDEAKTIKNYTKQEIEDIIKNVKSDCTIIVR